MRTTALFAGWLTLAALFPTVASARSAKSSEGPAAGSVNAAQTGTTLSTSDRPASDWTFSYSGEYKGPGLGYPVDAGSVNADTGKYDPDTLQYVQSQITLDYNLTPDIFVGPIVNFRLIPLADYPFMALDSGVRVGHRKVIHTNDLDLSADFRVLAPLKPANRANGEWGALQSLQVFTYKIPGTRFKAGIVGKETVQFYGATAPIKPATDPSAPRDLSLYLAPYVSYEIVKRFSAVLFYEMYPCHALGSGFGADPADISPGFSWEFLKDATVSPQLLIYPSQLRWDSIGTVVYLNLKFF